MTCPKCQFEQQSGLAECLRCGIVFSKWKPRAIASADQTLDQRVSTKDSPKTQSRLGWSKVEKHNVFTGLAQLLNSGKTIAQAMNLLAQGANDRTRLTLEALANSAESSGSFTKAAQGHSLLLTDSEVATISLFESARVPGIGFQILASKLEYRRRLIRRLLRSSMYPTLMMVMVAFGQPIQRLVSESPGAYMTQALLNLLMLFGTLLILFFAVPWGVRWTNQSGALSRWAWHIPVFNRLYVARLRSRFALIVSQCMSQGIVVQDACRHALQVVQDPRLSERVQREIDRLEEGAAVADALIEAWVVAKHDRMTLVAGISSYGLAETLGKLAVQYEEEAERQLGWCISALGLLVTLAVMVYAGLFVYRAYTGVLGRADNLINGVEGGDVLNSDLMELLSF